MTTQALTGKVAIVTGGARGIGLAISETLIKLGAKVVVADNGTSIDGNGEDAAVATGAATQLGANAVAFGRDIATPEAAAAAVKLAIDAFGGIDIIVNNAAILRDSFIFKAEPKNFDKVIQNNLSAAFYLANAATPIMREQFKTGRGNGRIVNMVSSAGLYGNFGQSAYASAKAGLFGLTRVIALDMARSGVTVNAIAPFARTRVTDIIQPANEQQATYKEYALQISPQHVANLVAYLVSDKAQSVTGQVFGVRGREIFLFSQPRPVAKIVNDKKDWDIDSLSNAIEGNFAALFTDATTDLEAFNTPPVV